ncbi:late cornified envelope protein 3D-like [Suncus etruscus]|uniref:late cornified envelope protein 3D-like n=1 Tax=Suncus etruscus TaxID=109475 RepID=UPI002110DE55|nr:late cornified envelope protein 3D-like [Suncus etruscus]
MSCQQSQQKAQTPAKCPSPKCHPKSPAQCSPAAPSGCALPSGGCHGPSSEGGCCLSPHRRRRSHRCRRRSSSSCERPSDQLSGGSGCGQGSGGCC